MRITIFSRNWWSFDDSHLPETLFFARTGSGDPSIFALRQKVTHANGDCNPCTPRNAISKLAITFTNCFLICLFRALYKASDVTGHKQFTVFTIILSWLRKPISSTDFDCLLSHSTGLTSALFLKDADACINNGMRVVIYEFRAFKFLKWIRPEYSSQNCLNLDIFVSNSQICTSCSLVDGLLVYCKIDFRKLWLGVNFLLTFFLILADFYSKRKRRQNSCAECKPRQPRGGVQFAICVLSFGLLFLGRSPALVVVYSVWWARAVALLCRIVHFFFLILLGHLYY